MKKLIKLLTMIFLVFALLTGCSADQAATDPVETNEGVEINEGLESDEGLGPSEEAGTNEEVPYPMDETIALELVNNAIEHILYVRTGGNIAGELETFDHNGMEFRYLGEDLQPKSKLINYLQEVFTPEAAEEFIQGYIEVNGRMAQPNADGGSILQWDEAEVSLIQEFGNSKEYAFEVPYGDENNLQYETYPIQLTLVEDMGWRVAGGTGLFE